MWLNCWNASSRRLTSSFSHRNGTTIWSSRSAEIFSGVNVIYGQAYSHAILRCRSEWNNWFVLISSSLHLQDWDLQKETSKFKDCLALFYLACIGPLMCSMDHHTSGFAIKGQRLLHHRGKRLHGSNINSMCGIFFACMFCSCVMCIWDSEFKKYLCSSTHITNHDQTQLSPIQPARRSRSRARTQMKSGLVGPHDVSAGGGGIVLL